MADVGGLNISSAWLSTTEFYPVFSAASCVIQSLFAGLSDYIEWQYRTAFCVLCGLYHVMVAVFCMVQ